MESPHITVLHHHAHQSRSNRHRTRGDASRGVKRKRGHHELSRHNLPAEADGNKENLIQGWLHDLGATKQGAVNGIARPHRTTETSNHENSPPTSYRPPGRSATVRDTTSYPRPRQDRSKSKYEKRDRSALENDPIVAPKPWLDRETAIAGGSRSRHLRLISEQEPPDRGDSRRHRDEESTLSSNGPSQEDLRFQKKRRHQPRTDRYDVVKKKDAVPEIQRKKPNKVSKKKRQTKETLTSAREVMDTFSSASILNDRITIQPLVGPGLFDNGRQSRKQLVTDLTFHNMDYLRKPRRESQKPQSHKCEADKKRADREREEVSAFFLQPNAPSNIDLREKSKPTTAWFPSADGAPVDTSSHVSGRRRHSSYAAVAAEQDRYPAVAHEREPNEKSEEGRTTTYLSWTPTPSRASSKTRTRLTRKPPKDQNSSRSQTPARVREALAETGIFHNTGIRRMATNCEDDKIWSRPEQVVPQQRERSPHHPVSWTHQERRDEPIRIVRYQDRGTMVNQDDTRYSSPDKRKIEVHIRTCAATGRERTQKASEVPKSTSVGSRAAVASGLQTQPLCQIEDPRTFLGSSQVFENPTATDDNDAEREAQPERAVPPNLSIVERLEAAASNHQWNFIELETAQPAGRSDWYSGRSGGSVPESRSLFHENALQWPAHTTRLEARETPVAMRPCFKPKQSLGPLDRHTTMRDATIERPDFAYHYTSPIQWADQIAPSLLPTQNPTYLSQHTQDMRRYITQLEGEVLGGPQEDAEFESPPLVDLDTINMGEDLGSTCHQVQEQYGVRFPSRLSVTPMQEHPSGASNLGWVRAWNLEDNQEEERRFRTSFWRPNCYPT